MSMNINTELRGQKVKSCYSGTMQNGSKVFGLIAISFICRFFLTNSVMIGSEKTIIHRENFMWTNLMTTLLQRSRPSSGICHNGRTNGKDSTLTEFVKNMNRDLKLVK